MQFRRGLCLLGLLAGFATAVAQQPVASLPLSHHDEALKAQLQKLGPDSDLSVIPLQGEERFGQLEKVEDSGFTFYDIDTKTIVQMEFRDVRKVRRGYGGYNHLAHRHTDRRRAILIGIVIVGGLLVLAVLAGRS